MSVKRPPLMINFAATDYRFVGRARAVLLVLIVLLCILAAGMAVLAAGHRDEAAAVRQEIKSLAETQQKLRPVIEERQRLVNNLSEMKELVDARRFSWTGLLSAIEKVFPNGVALEQLEYRPKERIVSLEGKASSPEALSNLMIGLTRTAMLKNPVLKRQSMEKGILSFNVTVTYHEPAAPAVAAGTVRRASR